MLLSRKLLALFGLGAIAKMTSVAAFFYPDSAAQSELGGSESTANQTQLALRAAEFLVFKA
jgi:hypothetical protein